MARHPSTYRAERRNICLKDPPRMMWLRAGIQLDPWRYQPTKMYSAASEGTPPDMFKRGLSRIRRFTKP